MFGKRAGHGYGRIVERLGRVGSGPAVDGMVGGRGWCCSAASRDFRRRRLVEISRLGLGTWQVLVNVQVMDTGGLPTARRAGSGFPSRWPPGDLLRGSRELQISAKVQVTDTGGPAKRGGGVGFGRQPIAWSVDTVGVAESGSCRHGLLEISRAWLSGMPDFGKRAGHRYGRLRPCTLCR